jgi:hypothetical protein
LAFVLHCMDTSTSKLNACIMRILYYAFIHILYNSKFSEREKDLYLNSVNSSVIPLLYKKADIMLNTFFEDLKIIATLYFFW